MEHCGVYYGIKYHVLILGRYKVPCQTQTKAEKTIFHTVLPA
jgi:hypothetical protein